MSDEVKKWQPLLDRVRSALAPEKVPECRAVGEAEAGDALAALESLCGTAADYTGTTAALLELARPVPHRAEGVAKVVARELLAFHDATMSAVLASARAGTFAGAFAPDREAGEQLGVYAANEPGMVGGSPWRLLAPSAAWRDRFPHDCTVRIPNTTLDHVPLADNFYAPVPLWLKFDRCRERARKWNGRAARSAEGERTRLAAYAAEAAAAAEHRRRNRPATAGEVEDLRRELALIEGTR